jgi:hypothetical protein
MITTYPGWGRGHPGQVHDTGAHSLWRRIQPRVSSRGHPVPCSAIRSQALLDLYESHGLVGFGVIDGVPC